MRTFWATKTIHWQPLVRGTRSCRGTGICMSLTCHRCQLVGISGIWQCFGVSGRQQVMRQFVCLSVCLCLDMAVADLCLLPIACSHISHFTYGQCFRQEDARKKYLKQRIWGNPSQKNSRDTRTKYASSYQVREHSMHIHTHIHMKQLRMRQLHMRQLRMRHTKHAYILGNKDHTLAALS